MLIFSILGKIVVKNKNIKLARNDMPNASMKFNTSAYIVPFTGFCNIAIASSSVENIFSKVYYLLDTKYPSNLLFLIRLLKKEGY